MTSSPPTRAGRGPGPPGIGPSRVHHRCLRASGGERRNRFRGGIVHRHRGRSARARGTAGASSFSTGRSQKSVRTISSSIARLHVLEERVALLLVLDERIALPVAAQPDAFLQVIERVEVILPLVIDDLQHDVALDATQQLAADHAVLFLVAGFGERPDGVADFVRALRLAGRASRGPAGSRPKTREASRIRAGMSHSSTSSFGPAKRSI